MIQRIYCRRAALEAVNWRLAVVLGGMLGLSDGRKLAKMFQTEEVQRALDVLVL